MKYITLVPRDMHRREIAIKTVSQQLLKLKKELEIVGTDLNGITLRVADGYDIATRFPKDLLAQCVIYDAEEPKLLDSKNQGLKF